jgi:hypothetical protein
MAFVEVMVPYLLVKHTEREDAVECRQIGWKIACLGNWQQSGIERQALVFGSTTRPGDGGRRLLRGKIHI